jgi:hypothetical protein
VVTEADEEAKHHVEDVAATLGLSIVRSFAQGTYGAVLVATASGEELVLKTQPDLTLEPVWTVGAEMRHACTTGAIRTLESFRSGRRARRCGHCRNAWADKCSAGSR